MTADDPLVFPFPAHGLSAPHEFEAMRADSRLRQVTLPYGESGWLLCRHADVLKALVDPRMARAETVGADVPRLSAPRPAPGNLMSMDPPEHTHLKKIVANSFTAVKIRRWEPRIREVVSELISDMRQQGPGVDFVEAFASQLPVTVVCELLGVPVEDRHLFRRVAEIVFATDGYSYADMVAAGEELASYLSALLPSRRKHPSNDLLSDMLCRQESEGVSDREIIDMAGSILVAGHEATAQQIANMVFLMITTDKWCEIVDDPSIIPTALEELLRYIPLGSGYNPPRATTEDVQFSQGQVPKGAYVIANLISANRDPNIFKQPGQLQLRRNPNPHLSFGAGTHHCLGAALARLELKVALEALTAAFPHLELAGPPDAIRWRGGQRARGPVSLPLRWTSKPSEQTPGS